MMYVFGIKIVIALPARPPVFGGKMKKVQQ